MKKSTIVVLSIVGVLVLLVVSVLGWGIGTYNSLVSKQENVQKYASDIQADLQRRSDLIPNLVETVKDMPARRKKFLPRLPMPEASWQGQPTSKKALRRILS